MVLLVLTGDTDEHLIGFVKADPVVMKNDAHLLQSDDPEGIFSK